MASKAKALLEALRRAAAEGDLPAVRSLLDEGAKPDIRQSGEWTPLMAAVREGHLGVVDELVNRGADASFFIRHPDWGRTCALWEAIREEQFEMGSFRIDRGADIEFADEDGGCVFDFALGVCRSPLEDETKRPSAMALIEGFLVKGAAPSARELVVTLSAADPDLRRLFLSHGTDVNTVAYDDDPVGRAMVPDGESALARAVSLGREEGVAELLDAGADPNVTIPLRGPCINDAVANGRLGIVQLLAEAGADLNRKANATIGDFGEGQRGSGENASSLIFTNPVEAREATPLVIAVRQRNLEAVRILVEAGADLDAPDGDGKTPVAWAERLGHDEMVDHLRRRGAGDSSFEGNPQNRLYNAAAREDLAALREALACGADVNGFTDRRGTRYTPLIRAASAGKLESVKALLRAGADPNLAGVYTLATNFTPLMAAAGKGRADVVRCLLDAGARCDVRTGSVFGHKSGETAAQIAKSEGHGEMARLLRSEARKQPATDASEDTG